MLRDCNANDSNHADDSNEIHEMQNGPQNGYARPSTQLPELEPMMPVLPRGFMDQRM